ncbi:hypothetical protein SY88_03330 [Clostridiales bacterium PH28_bin88]|nr:hypothetical protein SY88_03330 [Clostridiales bacterium PH28_bin88]
MFKQMLKVFVAVYVIGTLIYLPISGNVGYKEDLHANDVYISANVDFFDSAWKYKSFFMEDTFYIPEEQLTEYMKDKIAIKIRWEIRSKKVNYNTLYYPPDIIIIPPNNQWGYIGLNKSAPLVSSVSSSVDGEVIKHVLNNVSDYNWINMSSKNFGKIFRAKSFGQGMVDLVYVNHDIPDYPQIFKGYFVYYNPREKKGWAKPFEIQYQPHKFYLP